METAVNECLKNEASRKHCWDEDVKGGAGCLRCCICGEKRTPASHAHSADLAADAAQYVAKNYAVQEIPKAELVERINKLLDQIAPAPKFESPPPMTATRAYIEKKAREYYEGLSGASPVLKGVWDPPEKPKTATFVKYKRVGETVQNERETNAIEGGCERGEHCSHRKSDGSLKCCCCGHYVELPGLGIKQLLAKKPRPDNSVPFLLEDLLADDAE